MADFLTQSQRRGTWAGRSSPAMNPRNRITPDRRPSRGVAFSGARSTVSMSFSDVRVSAAPSSFSHLLDRLVDTAPGCTSAADKSRSIATTLGFAPENAHRLCYRCRLRRAILAAGRRQIIWQCGGRSGCQVSRQESKIAACPNVIPMSFISCQTTPFWIQKRRPLREIRRPL